LSGELFDGGTPLKIRDVEMIKESSPEQQVHKNSPKTFTVLAKDGPAVPPENGIRFHDALRKSGISSELHVFVEGGHGFGIRDTRQLPTGRTWPRSG
jgi:dipeptidyl aminopeptidase/acylaminoacyl peptidase